MSCAFPNQFTSYMFNNANVLMLKDQDPMENLCLFQNAATVHAKKVIELLDNYTHVADLK